MKLYEKLKGDYKQHKIICKRQYNSKSKRLHSYLCHLPPVPRVKMMSPWMSQSLWEQRRCHVRTKQLGLSNTCRNSAGGDHCDPPKMQSLPSAGVDKDSRTLEAKFDP